MTLISRIAAILRRDVAPKRGDLASEFSEVQTELDLFLTLTTDPAIANVIESLGVNVPNFRQRLAEQQLCDPTASRERFHYVLRCASDAWNGKYGRINFGHSRHVNLIAYAVTLGSDEIRKIIAVAGVQPADIPFILAHAERESDLRAAWPDASPEQSRFLIVNDPYSPMEVVLECLQEALNVDRDRGIELMIKVHREGVVATTTPGSIAAVPFCDTSNSRWRRRGIPLYFRPPHPEAR